MGIFNKTDEEKRQEEEKRLLVSLRDKINYSNELDQFTTKTLVNYLNGVINETRKNDFFDTEFLVRVFDQLTANEYANGTDVKEHLVMIISALQDFFPYGRQSDNFEKNKEFFINNLVGPEGYINKGIYDPYILKLIRNRDNYARLMTSINKNERAVKDFSLIKKHIIKVGGYQIEDEPFMKDVLSTISRLDSSVLDVEKYLNDEFEKSKRLAGDLQISHDDILIAIKENNRMKALIENGYALMDQLTQQGDNLSKMRDGISGEIEVEKEEAIRDIETVTAGSCRTIESSSINMEATMKKNLLKAGDKMVSEIRVTFNDDADLAFSNASNKYQDKLDETNTEYRECIHKLAELRKQLAELRNEITELMAEYNTYKTKTEEGSATRDELKKYLEEMDKNADVQARLLELIEMEKKALGSVKSSSNKETKRVQGINRLVAPASPKVEVPDSIYIPKDIQIISPYAFKNAKEYKQRLDAIKSKMKENEENGEIYHTKVLEIIECLMVGDWPYMFGPSGAGKGYIVKQIGELLGQKVIDGGKIGEVHTVLGYIDPQGRFMAPPALDACVNGGLIFFDEFDNGNSDTQVALNTMYSNLRDKIKDPSSQQFIKFANGQINIPINPNMRMIAAGNTDGTGSDELHTDRYPIDESIKERYKAIYTPYDNRVEAHIFGVYNHWYNFFILFREACEQYAIAQGQQSAAGNASTRDASDIFRDVSLNAKTLDQMMSQYFVQIKDEDYRGELARKIAYHYKINSDQTSLTDYKGDLGKVTDEQIAKQFIKRCNLGIRG